MNRFGSVDAGFRRIVALCVAALCLMAHPALPQGSPFVHSLAVFRFAEGRLTRIEGLLNVPAAMLTVGPDRNTTYYWEIALRGAEGRVIVRRGGEEKLMQVSGDVTISQRFSVLVPAGVYELESNVVDVGSLRKSVQRHRITAFAAMPRTSDLWVEETEPGLESEARLGTFELHVVKPIQAVRDGRTYAFRLDLYRSDATVTLRAVGSDGMAIPLAAPSRDRATEWGRRLEGRLSLDRVPAGTYRIEAVATFSDTVVSTSTLLPLAGEDADLFAGLTETELDDLYAPVGDLLLAAAERGNYSMLGVDDKRAYFRRLWNGRAAFRDAFYQRVAEANAMFDEAWGEGWRTDRGRTYVLRGRADTTFSRNASATHAAFEVWRYERPPRATYVFIDGSGRGEYALMYATGPEPVERRNWRALLGPEVVSVILEH